MRAVFGGRLVRVLRGKMESQEALGSIVQAEDAYVAVETCEAGVVVCQILWRQAMMELGPDCAGSYKGFRKLPFECFAINPREVR